MLKSGTLHLAGAGSAKILVDNLNLLEAQLAGVIGEAVLSSLALLIENHLTRRRLPNIDDGPPAQVIRCNLRIHSCSSDFVPHGSTTAFNSRSAKAAASSRCLPSGNTIGLLSQKGRFICGVPGVFFGCIRVIRSHLPHCCVTAIGA